MFSCQVIDKVAPLKFTNDPVLEEEHKKKESKLMKLTQKLGATRLEPNHRIPLLITAVFRMEVKLQENYRISQISTYPSNSSKWEKKATNFMPCTASPNMYMVAFCPIANGIFKFHVEASSQESDKNDIKIIECNDQNIFVPFAIDFENLRPTRNVRIEGRPSGIAVSEEKGFIFVAEYENDCIKVLNNKGDIKIFCAISKPCDVGLTPDNCLVIIGSMSVCKISLSSNEASSTLATATDKMAKEAENSALQQQIVASIDYPDNDFTSVAVSHIDGLIYVVQKTQCCIAVFTPDLIPYKSFGVRGEHPIGRLGHFQKPYGIAIDNKGIIYITDISPNSYHHEDHHRFSSGEIYKFHPSSGQYLDHIHCEGFIPLCIDISPTGLVYVTRGEKGVVVFTETGQFVREISVKKPALAISYDCGTLAFTTGRRILVYDYQKPRNMKEMPDTTITIKEYD